MVQLSPCLAALVCVLGYLLIGDQAPAQTRFREVLKQHVPEPGLGADPQHVGDLDGDGREDLLALRGPFPTVMWSEPDGTLSVGPTFDLLARGRLLDRDLADFDGDGHLDVLLMVGSAPIIYFGEPGRTFRQDAAAVPQLTGNLQQATVADVDGDGDADLLFTGPMFTTSLLCLGDGQGGFTPQVAAQVPDEVEVFGSADVDGDGNLDLIAVSRRGLADLAVYLGDGAGNFIRDVGVWFRQSYLSIESVAIADLDADGDVDLAVGRSESSVAVDDLLLLNDGAGRGFVDSTPLWSPPLALTRALAVADLDGDGDLDLVGAFQDQGYRWWANDGNARFSPGSLPAVDGWAYSLAPFDLDGDGLGKDLIVNGGQTQLLVNSGLGLFENALAPSVVHGNGQVGAVRAADLDGDATVDLLVSLESEFSGYEPYLLLLRGLGNGRFVPVDDAFVGQAPRRSRSLAVVDVDRDGDLDVVQPYGPTLWLNDGRGRFTNGTAGRFPGPANETFDAVLAVDVDNDAAVDLVFLERTQPRLLLNLGSGSFIDASIRLPAGFSMPRLDSTVAADVDGDGDQDLLGELLVLNDGGFFRAAPRPWFPIISSPSTCAPIDFDQDGDLDVLFAARFSATQLLENQGDGRFVSIGTVAGAANGIESMSLGDVDEDGVLDVLAMPGDAPTEIWYGDGAAGFRVEPAGIDGSSRNSIPSRALLVDVDGDRAVDAVTSRVGRSRVHVNLATRLEAPLLARRGRPWQLDLTWAAGAPATATNAFVVLSSGRGLTRLGLFGDLLLDTSVLVPFGPVALDAQGRGSVRIPVPDTAAVVGILVTAQAVFLPAAGRPRLSHLMVERVL